MLDIRFVREQADIVKQAVKDKGIDLDIDLLLSIDKDIVAAKTELQSYNERKNQINNEIKGNPDNKEELFKESKALNSNISALNEKIANQEKELKLLMYLTPTIPSKDAPVGKSDEDNVIIKTVGEKPVFDFTPLDHSELIAKNNWIEPRIPDVCGSRQVGLKGNLVRFEMAVWQHAINKLSKKGFVPLSVPSMAYGKAFYATGHFPFDEENMYFMPKDNLYLSGTAEVILTGIHAGEIISDDSFPILYVGFSPCFRREAGSAGKDVKGVFRIHQFMKVEQYVICPAEIEESDKWQQCLLENSEEMLRDLEVPYQIVECCTGDMGAGKYRMFDIESWSPAQQRYRETHSCSALLDWQARRANIRYRDSETGKVKFAYTLNNTCIATPRVFVSVLENHQQKDGRVKIPKALRPYMDNEEFL
jgi:seryl-tRNA synthetase